MSLVVLVLVVAAALVFFTPLGERPMSALFPVGDPPVPEPEALDTSGARNSYLVCPDGRCARPHGNSPVFDVPVDRLCTAWDEAIAGEARVSLRGESGPQREYVQRTPLFRFPDLITVRFVPVSESRSSVIVYSRSVYGISDLGTNRKRVNRWLGKLSGHVAR